MKKLIVFCFLTSIILLLASFNRKTGSTTDEDVTAYVYAFKTIKNPTYSETASVFTPVFAVTVDKDDFNFWADAASSALQWKLKKYIEGVMGKELVSPTLTCCYFYEDSRNKAEEDRLEKIADERNRKGRQIKYTGLDFSFSWNWKEDGGK